jgi:CubicO group peptidase (beta-lactamase class C family)
VPERIVKRFVARPVPAGDGYHDSGTNYILAGLLIEQATGRDYYDVLRHRILDLPGLVPGHNQGEAMPGDYRDTLRDRTAEPEEVSSFASQCDPRPLPLRFEYAPSSCPPTRPTGSTKLITPATSEFR